MTGALTVADLVNPIRFSKGDVALHAYADGTLGVLNVAGSAAMPILVSELFANAFKGTGEFDVGFKAWDGGAYQIVATMRYGSDYRFDIGKAGNIDIVDDHFLKIGRITNIPPDLPTPSAEYRGKLIRVQGTPDRLFMCRIDATGMWEWGQIQFVP